MFLFQWRVRKSADSIQSPNPNVQLKSHRVADNATLAKKPKSGNTHSDKNAVIGQAHREDSKFVPRGRHLMAASHISSSALLSAPNPVSSSKTRQPSTNVPQSTHSRTRTKSAIDPTLLNDPAFSADPRLNPHHSMSHHGAHFSAAVVSSATRSKKQAFYRADDNDEYRLRQPPNSPQDAAPEYRESAKTTYIPSQSTSSSTLSPPSLSSSSSTTSHTSSSSSTPQTPPTHTALPTSTPASGSGMIDYPPAYKSHLVATAPALLYNRTTQDHRQGAEEPLLPQRPVTMPTYHQTRRGEGNGSDNSRYRTITSRSPHVRELDRIDELDETDPLGLPWHHGGPYEALTRLTHEKARLMQFDSHGPAADYLDNAGRKHRSRKVARHIRDGVGGISLNLAPGQILPHIPDLDPRSLIPPHPLLHKPPHNSGDSYFRRHTHSYPQDVLPPIYPQSEPHDDNALQASSHEYSSRIDDRRAQAPEKSSQTSLPVNRQVKEKRAPAKLVRARKDSHDRNHVSERTDQETNPFARSGSYSDTGEGQMQQQFDHSRLQVPLATQPSANPDVPHSTQPRPSSSRGHVGHVHAEHELGSPQDAPATYPSSDEAHHSGVQSSAPSIETSSSSQRSASTRYRNEAPKHHHLPKRLVMPMPLQPQQSASQASGPHMSTRPGRHTSRSKAGSQPRAQEIPMQPETRKLVRKRTTALNQNTFFPLAPILPPVRDVDLDGVPSPPNEQRETISKRLLSKRRNDL